MDLSGGGGAVRGGLGAGPEVHRRLDPALAEPGHPGGDGGELLCLSQALKAIPIGTGYAIWTGIGAVGVAIVGILVFAESASPARLACIAMIVCGIVGLKLVSG